MVIQNISIFPVAPQSLIINIIDGPMQLISCKSTHMFFPWLLPRDTYNTFAVGEGKDI